jgi:hypothetical protein
MSVLASLDIGDDAVCTVTFTVTIDGVATPTDPTDVTFSVRPEAALTPTTFTFPAAEITNPTTGTFKLTYPCTQGGQRHYVRAVGTGVAKAAIEGEFFVRDSAVI